MLIAVVDMPERSHPEKEDNGMIYLHMDYCSHCTKGWRRRADNSTSSNVHKALSEEC